MFCFFFSVTPGPAREPSSLRVKVLMSPSARPGVSGDRWRYALKC